MEPLAKIEQVVVERLYAGYSDVDGWSALWEITDKGEQGIVPARGTILKDTSDSYIYGQDRLITTLGIDNLVIVDTPDALLIANKDSVQDIKKIVSQIKESGCNEHHQHRQVYRPWAHYDSIDNGKRY